MNSLKSQKYWLTIITARPGYIYIFFLILVIYISPYIYLSKIHKVYTIDAGLYRTTFFQGPAHLRPVHGIVLQLWYVFK